LFEGGADVFGAEASGLLLVIGGVELEVGELFVDLARVHGESVDPGEGSPASPGEDAEGVGEGEGSGGDGEVAYLQGLLDEGGAGEGGSGGAFLVHEIFAGSDELIQASADDADLDEGSDSAAALAEEAPGDDALLGEGFEDGREAAALGETDQVEHGGEALAASGVVRGGGEVAEGGRVGEIEGLAEEADAACGEELGGFCGPARCEGLDAQVVFLVDHDAERALLVKHEGAAGFAPFEVGGGEAAADEVFALGVGDVAVDGEIESSIAYGVQDLLEDELELLGVGAMGEAVAGEVAQEARAGAEDDVGVRRVAAQPSRGRHRPEDQTLPGFRLANRLRHTVISVL